MAGQVAGKVALVTGGASGIGEACCETLAREGAKVVVTDLDETGGGYVVERIKKSGGEAMFLTQDVTDEARWQPVIDAALKAYGRLDILVANAGIGIMTPIVDMTLTDWRRQQVIAVLLHQLIDSRFNPLFLIFCEYLKSVKFYFKNQSRNPCLGNHCIVLLILFISVPLGIIRFAIVLFIT